MRGTPVLAQHVYARLRRGIIVASTIALVVGLSPAIVASAEPVTPSTPTTSADAKELWIAAANKAAALNEQVLQADEDVSTAAANIVTADTAVAAAGDAVTAAEAVSAQATVKVGSYTDRLNTFANASFRGARLSQFSSLLTADSAESFLDEVSSLDRVAGSTSKMLAEAAAAKNAAASAATAVAAKKVEAEAAKTAATAASEAAVKAQTDLAASKASLDAEAATYETLYNQLTEAERQAAIKAEEERLEREAAAAAAAAAQAAAAQAAAASRAAQQAAAQAPAAQAQAQVAVAGEAAQALAPAEAPAVSQSAPNSAAAAAVAAALSKVGSRYIFGAAGPSSFDCSGLTSWAWAQAGVSIPRTSRDQSGLRSIPMDQLQPGDLITYYSPVSHVAMYIGDGQIVQASTETKPVYVTSIARGGPNASGHRPG
ncbi:NlpC/P60 family protein [Nakamurella antarctica]|uniref:NlpC/P60 family protein n=1 Tax=Nakamurella antarctica TaxID=1902245 RepID=A0A3G8ZUT5_9ACTN|nr:C40 family peptidase [Nakamurella antarctica]AZI57786.1 NlpC/P60 family protein [Nakamurella antarctica]